MRLPLRPRELPATSVGTVRGKPDLARFSLDLKWAKSYSAASPVKSYPTPSMSGSPSQSKNYQPEFGSHRHGYDTTADQFTYGLPQQAVSQNNGRRPGASTYSGATLGPPFQSYSSSTSASFDIGQYQQQPSQSSTLPMPSLAPYAFSQNQQPLRSPFQIPDRPSTGDAPESAASKNTRKIKGHVASACVPCKKAHLR
jgi:hypothetical protein